MGWHIQSAEKKYLRILHLAIMSFKSEGDIQLLQENKTKDFVACRPAPQRPCRFLLFWGFYTAKGSPEG